MKLRGIHVEPVSYRLRVPLKLGRGRISERSGFRVRLVDESGAEGWGEALPLPELGSEYLTETGAAIENFAGFCSERPFGLSGLLDVLDQQVADTPAARCGLDVAAHNLEAQLQNVPVWRLLSSQACRTVHVNAVIGAVDPEPAARAAAEAIARGYRTVKLKVGNANAESDLERVAAVRDQVRDDAEIRIDANGAWTAQHASSMLQRLAPFRIELAEQPVAAKQLTELSRLSAESPIPIAADESLTLAEGRAAFIAGELASIAVLKPMLLGGLRSCQRLARRASRLGLRSFITTTFDGPITTLATLHLAGAIPDCDLAHGLAAAESVDEVFPDELWPRGGSLSVPGVKSH